MKQVRASMAVIAVLVVASACTGIQNTQPGEVTPETLVDSPTPGEPTATLIPEQPASTPTATFDPTPTLPASTEHGFSLGELLFEGTVDCALPCWYGIVPGESTEKDVDTTIQSVFGIDLSEEQRYDFQILPTTSKDLARQYYTKGYSWYTGESNSDGAFYVDVSFDEATQTLELLRMMWSTGNSSRFKIDLSPLDAIRKMGAPSHMAAHLQTSARTDYGMVRLLLVYPQGVVFQFDYIAMTFITTPTDNPAIQDTHVEICLGTEETEPQTNIGYIVGDVFLMQPFSADLEDLTPVQASVITDLIEFYQYAPVDGVFGVSPQAIAAQAASGDDVCLSTIINY